MLSVALTLLAHAMLLSLHLSSGSFPKPLSAREERDCVARMLEGDMDARNTLIEHNLRLVAHIVKKYYTQSEEQDDLVSVGTIGLIKGVSSYRPEKGTRLATYAAKCIENEILMYCRARSRSTIRSIPMATARRSRFSMSSAWRIRCTSTSRTVTTACLCGSSCASV